MNQSGVCFEKKNITVLVNPCLDSEDWDEFKVRVYPNPASDFIAIEKPAETTVSVYDGLGIMVHAVKAGNDKLTINTNNWINGIYSVRLETSTGVRVFKILKTN